MSDADPTRVVADADVLAADLLVGGPSRQALDQIRAHDWLDLLASDALLDDATAVITTLTNEDLATRWRRLIEERRTAVSHPEGDQPALASAYRGGAAHLLTFDDTLASAATNRSLQPHVSLSIRSPDAFVRLFDPVSLYNSCHDDEYSGPDRDPRA
jgi:predicted nucleic acid-binding protein